MMGMVIMVEYPHKTAGRAQVYLGALVAVFCRWLVFGAILLLRSPQQHQASLYLTRLIKTVFYSLKSASLQAFMSSVSSILWPYQLPLAVARSSALVRDAPCC